MQVEGSCHCGKITYRAEVEPSRASICHCTDCQALTGSPYRTSIPTVEGTFRLLSGTPRLYVKKTAESGVERAHGFCGDCGSPVFAKAVDGERAYMLRLGGVKQRAQLPPRRQIWCRSALPWASDIGGLPKVEKQPA